MGLSLLQERTKVFKPLFLYQHLAASIENAPGSRNPGGIRVHLCKDCGENVQNLPLEVVDELSIVLLIRIYNFIELVCSLQYSVPKWFLRSF